MSICYILHNKNKSVVETTASYCSDILSAAQGESARKQQTQHIRNLQHLFVPLIQPGKEPSVVFTPAPAAKIVPESSKYTGAVIDTDVHETFTSWDELIPYLKHP